MFTSDNKDALKMFKTYLKGKKVENVRVLYKSSNNPQFDILESAKEILHTMSPGKPQIITIDKVDAATIIKLSKVNK